MAANTAPIFTKDPKAGWATLTTANTAKDGTGTVSTLLTAGANGQLVDRVVAKPLGTNIASVLRLFLNNGSSPATPANNTYLADVSLPATTISEVAGQPVVEIALGFALPAGYKINACIGTTVAAGWAVAAFGGDY